MTDRLDRREFIGRTAAVGIGIAALGEGAALGQDAGAKSKVVTATRDNACADMEPHAAVVKEMVDAVVMKLAGKATPAEGWAQFVRPDDIVGIKINCLFGIGACTHPEVTRAVVEGCKLAGVPESSIIVWDRKDKDLVKCGYEINRDAGVKCYGVNADWEPEPTAIHTCQGRLAKILTQDITALISVPVLKTHGLSGITMALKNHYGSFHNPWDAHGNHCDPFLAHLNALPAIRHKTRLIVGDALLPVADGGPKANPQWTWEHKAILAATNPVAADYVGLRMLDERRAQLGKPSLEQSGKARSIVTAAQMGLGVAEMSNIELVQA